MIDVEVLWVEKYRPRKIADCVLPSSLKQTFQQYVDKKEVPNLLLTGSSGVGKTTVARAMLEETDYDYILLNGSEESGIDTLRVKIKGYASSVSLSGARKAVIVDEADYLTAQAQAAFRGVIEEFADNCSFIFTCNFKNRIIDAIHSRCAVIDFKIVNGEKPKMMAGFCMRALEILDKEKIKYDRKAVALLVTKFFPDNRRILNELQRYSLNGQIDESILSQLPEAKLEEVVQHLKSKNFQLMRKWVAMNADVDIRDIMSQLYYRAYEFLDPKSVPVVVIIVAKYMDMATRASDQQINLAACLTEIMVEAQWK